MVDILRPQTGQAVNKEAVPNVSGNKHIAVDPNSEDKFVRLKDDGGSIGSEPNAWSSVIHQAFAFEGGEAARQQFSELTHESKYHVMMSLQSRGSFTVSRQDLFVATMKEALERPLKENGHFKSEIKVVDRNGPQLILKV